MRVERSDGRFDDASQSETERLLLHRDLGSSQLDLELVDPGGAETISDHTGVIAPVEVQGADIGERASVATASRVGPSMRTSLRLAPSIAQPTGMP